MRKTLSLFLLILTFLTLTACDESLYSPDDPPPLVFDNAEIPTPEPTTNTPAEAITPVSDLPDESPSPSPVTDLPIEGQLPQWAIDIIPEDFPIMEFTLITDLASSHASNIRGVYSTSRSVVFTATATLSQFNAVTQALEENGFKHFIDITTHRESKRHQYYIDGKDYIISEVSFDDTTDLYTLEVYITWNTIVPQEGKVWPSKDTLGLEEIMFDKWPREYLPDNFPEPTALNIASMEQKKNGLFITFYTSKNALHFFTAQLKKSGYERYSYQGTLHPNYNNVPAFNSNLNRYYLSSEDDDAFFELVHSEEYIALSDGAREKLFFEKMEEWKYKDQYITFQIIKGEDTKKYWENIQ